MHKFKDFLLNEQKYYLGQKAGDVLTALQNLEGDAPQMGNRALMRTAESIVDQIRRVIHGRWSDEDMKYLKRLQKVGVALMKAIEEKDDMDEVIASSTAEIQDMLNALQVPINNIGAEQDRNMDDTGGIMPGTQMKA